VTADVLLADVAAQRDLDATEARYLIDGMRADVATLGERVTTAYLGRAWVALGYESWDAMTDAEFEGARLRIPREQRAEQVQSLRSAGLSTRAIGSVLGVDHKTVVNDLRSTGESSPVDLSTTVRSLDGRDRPASQPPRPVAEPLPPAPPEPAVTAEQFVAQRDTGEVLSPEQWEERRESPVDRAPKRRALADAFTDTTHELSKATERLERLVSDDRYPTNAEQVATKNRGDLLRAAEALARVLSRLTCADNRKVPA